MDVSVRSAKRVVIRPGMYSGEIVGIKDGTREIKGNVVPTATFSIKIPGTALVNPINAVGKLSKDDGGFFLSQKSKLYNWLLNLLGSSELVGKWVKMFFAENEEYKKKAINFILQTKKSVAVMVGLNDETEEPYNWIEMISMSTLQAPLQPPVEQAPGKSQATQPVEVRNTSNNLANLELDVSKSSIMPPKVHQAPPVPSKPDTDLLSAETIDLDFDKDLTDMFDTVGK